MAKKVLHVAKKVLFLSSANSVRSQMAEGFLRALAGDAFEAYSAGSVPRDVDLLATAVMAERGVDIAGQHAKGLQEFMGKARFDFLITVCDRAEKDCPMFPGPGTREFWPLGDPGTNRGSAEERLGSLREARDQIETHVRRFLVERRYQPVVKLSRKGVEGVTAES